MAKGSHRLRSRRAFSWLLFTWNRIRTPENNAVFFWVTTQANNFWFQRYSGLLKGVSIFAKTFLTAVCSSTWLYHTSWLESLLVQRLLLEHTVNFVFPISIYDCFCVRCWIDYDLGKSFVRLCVNLPSYLSRWSYIAQGNIAWTCQVCSKFFNTLAIISAWSSLLHRRTSVEIVLWSP